MLIICFPIFAELFDVVPEKPIGWLKALKKEHVNIANLSVQKTALEQQWHRFNKWCECNAGPSVYLIIHFTVFIIPLYDIFICYM